jgi:hypothetical protein
MTPRCRVIQCGTGVAGRQALAAILDRPDFELAGLLVHSAANTGREARDLAARPDSASRIVATDDFDAVLRLDAEAVCYMMLMPDLAQICALLRSGKNVVTTAGLMFPSWNDAAAERALQDACRAGRSSFHVTGINPGWVDEILPLTMSALCRRIRRVHIREYADCARYPAPHILNVMGFGRPLADVQEGRLPDLALMRDFFTQSVAALAQQLGLALDSISESREFAFAPRDYDIAAGHIAAGTIAGQRWRWAGIASGVERIVQETYWITTFDLGAGWPQRGALDNDTQWQVTLEGEPSLRCTFEPRYSFLHGAAQTAEWNPSGLATAMAAVNKLRPVCAAPPGVLNSADLPLPRGGSGGC